MIVKSVNNTKTLGARKFRAKLLKEQPADKSLLALNEISRCHGKKTNGDDSILNKNLLFIGFCTDDYYTTFSKKQVDFRRFVHFCLFVLTQYNMDAIKLYYRAHVQF